MIGFDRPLRPQWIYDLLKIIKLGEDTSTYNKIFEGIAKELTGKEGKRKVRTVLFRSFIYTVQKSKTKVEDTIFTDWIKSYNLKTLQPIFLSKLLIDYDVLRFASSKLFLAVDNQGHINTQHFSKKFIQEYGDRDIVRRSLRSFLKTLIFFGLAKEISKDEIVLLEKYALSEEQTKLFLIMYAKTYIKSQMLDIKMLDKNILLYFKELPIQETARKYNGDTWEYIREPSRELLLMK